MQTAMFANIDPRARLRGFAWHLAAYFVICAVAVAVNFALTPEKLWFVLPLVGWGAVLALHVAYVMGLFDVFFDK